MTAADIFLETLPELPGEVVTQALVRYVDLPFDAGTAALITLDNGRDHRRPTTLGPAGLRSLDAALDEVSARTDLAAIVVTGKPFIFCVGADLGVMRLGGTLEQALLIGREGHRIFGRLRDSRVPTFALINGAAMGGGLELALHCHYRTLSAAAAAVALPECFLGLIPGWGGTQLLPALVGIDRAVTVIVENPLNQNRVLKAPEAAALGIVDVLLDAADFLSESLRWVARVVKGEVIVDRPEVDRGEESWSAAIKRGGKVVAAKTRGLPAAPPRALELLALARTASFAEGTAAEDVALADLAMGEQLRAGLYAFDLVQKRAKRPAGAPDRGLARPVTMVGVMGAGLMASQLALLFLRRLEVPVVMTDVDQERVDKGLAAVHADIDKLLAKKQLSADRANRLRALVSGSTSLEAFAGADLVIEAVYEDLAVKQEVLGRLERVVAPECMLATNTSSLSVTAMAAGLEHPERVVGMHFFNPVAVLPLLEIVRGESTDEPTLATAFALGATLKKSCVLVADAPAFVFNRLLMRAMGEVIAAVDEGTPVEAADAAVSELGMPMSPFTLLSLVGPAIALHTGTTLHAAFPQRYARSPGLEALVAAEKPGVYRFDERGRPFVDPEVLALWPRGDAPSSAERVLERARGALAEEISLMLAEGVVAGPEEIDLCLLLGGGFGFWNGGITPYLDRTGTSERVTGRRFLAPGVASPE